jgi:hypothetical protein
MRPYERVTLETLSGINQRATSVSQYAALYSAGSGAMTIVDPIRYAWEGCNFGVPFPTELARTARVSPLAASLANVYELRVTGEFAGVRAAQAALHAFIVGDVRRFANPAHATVSGNEEAPPHSSGRSPAENQAPHCAVPDEP